MGVKFNPFTSKLDIVDSPSGEFSDIELALGTQTAPSLSFTGDPNTGIYSPGADQVAISTGGTGRLFVDASGSLTVTKGGTSGPITLFQAFNGSAEFKSTRTAGGSYTRINGTYAGNPTDYWSIGSNGYFDGSFSIWAGANNAERLRITSDGKLVLGTTVEGQVNADNLTIADSGSCGITIRSASDNFGRIYFSDGTTGDAEYRGIIQYDHTNDRLQLAANALAAITIDSSQRVGIGTASPGSLLEISGSSSASELRLRSTDATNATIRSYVNSLEAGKIAFTSGRELVIETAGNEAARIDSDGRLLVGTSSSSNNGLLQIKGNAGSSTSYAYLSLQRGELPGINADLGYIDFADNSGNQGAWIQARRDGGTWTSGSSHPTFLAFATTADGASSPTERMRITNGGFVNIGTQNTDIIWNQTAVNGITLGTVGVLQVARNADTPVLINRNGNDGTLIVFAQDGIQEGDITVSGTTVSYNGAHLSRWSQLPGGAVREEILRGTVLSNIDEMCEWGDEDNEQLNRMKVSDVEGDRNVSGVFQGWDNDDDTYTDDFYCAMTGDFIIRIANGVTVQRGDLLMSAGDGTAKPQDDDIVRSKTIAKVTSTAVSCTHPDGSYCVPCVLMAC